MMWAWLLIGLAALAYSERDLVESVAQDASVAIGEPVDNWTKFDALFEHYGAENDVDWRWLKAIALNESSLGLASSVAWGLDNPTDIDGSKSTDGKSWGLMQITLSTAKGMDPSASPVLLNNPEYSIGLAAQYVATLKDMFPESDPRFLEWVIKSYNQGPGNTRKEIGGLSTGYAQAYWERFQRNLNKVTGG